MVLADNQTRWNSVYLSITRAITFYAKIQIFSEDHRRELGANFLLQEDWNVLKWLAASLEPFWVQTQRLQGNARLGNYGVNYLGIFTYDEVPSGAFRTAQSDDPGVRASSMGKRQLWLEETKEVLRTDG
jgi:hypothetical protein